jgi:hypothetical protein
MKMVHEFLVYLFFCLKERPEAHNDSGSKHENLKLCNKDRKQELGSEKNSVFAASYLLT